VRPLLETCARSAAALDASASSALLDANDGDAAAAAAAAPSDRGGAGAPTAAVLPFGAGRIFMVNCLLGIWAPLSAHSACARQAQALKARAEAEVRSGPLCLPPARRSVFILSVRSRASGLRVTKILHICGRADAGDCLRDCPPATARSLSSMCEFCRRKRWRT
jgi:hypothetical protein